jgi:hypothetical protein
MSFSKPKVQKYKNEYKYEPNKYNKHMNNTNQIQNCCPKCEAILEWKKQYGKYKTITQPKKCSKCLLKRIVHSYHSYCKECSIGKCSKCLQDLEEQIEEKVSYDTSNLNERQKRSFHRKMERGDEQGALAIIEKSKANRDFDEFGSDDEF